MLAVVSQESTIAEIITALVACQFMPTLAAEAHPIARLYKPGCRSALFPTDTVGDLNLGPGSTLLYCALVLGGSSGEHIWMSYAQFQY